MYVAGQRALRAAMILDGQDPNVRVKTVVQLSPQVEKLLPTLAALAMDGISIGLSVEP